MARNWNKTPPEPRAPELDTFPKLLLDNAVRFAGRSAIREKEFGIWQSWTWDEVLGEVEALAGGLAALGFRRGDKLAVIGDNRPRLYWSMCAAQALGGVPVPMYQDSVADELAYVVEHSGVRFAVVQDQEQVDKLLEVCGEAGADGGRGGVRNIVYLWPKGLRHYDPEIVRDFRDVQAEGRKYAAAHPGFFREEAAKGRGTDVGVILYTSGTTGRPKGVVLTHDNVLKQAWAGAEFEGLGPDEDILAYLPMAWVGDNIFSYAQSYLTGFCVNCPESASTVMNDLAEVGPTFYFAPPRVYENLLTNVTIRMENAGRLKQRMFRYFMDVARRTGKALLDGEPAPLADRLLYRIGDLLVYGPLRNTLGFSRVRLAYTAGEAIGPDIFDFYRSIGINIKQLYGQTEASVFVTIQPDGEVDPETVGRPLSNVELKLTEDGEVLYRSPGVFQEYYRNPEATVETRTGDGWVRTGDAGFLDANGHLRIIDRAKDVGKLRDGSLFAPKYLENKLKFFPHVKEAVCFGDGRDRVTAFINIDLDAVGNWAERRGLTYSSYQELAGHPEVYDLVGECIEQVNRDLASDPQLAGSRIHRFLVLHKELDADDGELTRTQKVRRRIVADRYSGLIEALYGDVDRCRVSTEVTFEDGRKGSISADLLIRDATGANQPAAGAGPGAGAAAAG